MKNEMLIDVSEESKNATDSEHRLKTDDPDERILARRLRIQRRLDAFKKPKDGVQDGEKIHDKHNTPIDAHIKKSEELLNKLLREGRELVTNVRVANDAREKKRHAEELELSKLQREKLEKEAESGLKKFRAIANCWDDIASNHDVLNLHEDILKQKARCENLVEGKNFLINALNGELSRADNCYTKDLKKQAEDIALCAERIDSQVNAMRRAYKLELSLLEMAIHKEYEELVQEGNHNWMTLYKEQEENVSEQMKERFERVLQQQNEVYDTRVEFAEKYRQAKIALESDIQLLQQEVEQIKAMCLLNSEKLDYNFQVLKKREEENAILKSQQKRSITKLLDSISKLKLNIEDIEKKIKIEGACLKEEMVRLLKNIIDIEEKSILFGEANDRRYYGVWNMNRKNVLALINKVLDADRVICEQQLCMDWIPPDMSFLYDKTFESKRSSTPTKAEEETKTPAKGLGEQKRILLSHLLLKLAENSGFLLEDQLHALLVPYTSCESTLVCIDNIFLALEVKTITDVDILLEQFIPYLMCPVCDLLGIEIKNKSSSSFEISDLYSEEIIRSDDKMKEKKKTCFEDQQKSISKIKKANLEEQEVKKERLVSNEENASILPKRNEIMDKLQDTMLQGDFQDIPRVRSNKVEASRPKEDELDRQRKKMFCCPNSHPLKMSPVHILTAIQQFAFHVHRSCFGVGQCIPSRIGKNATPSRQMTSNAVEEYWAQFLKVFPNTKEKLWNGLLAGLQKYYLNLQERHKLVEETSKLRCQNAELRQLLHSYIVSNVDGKQKIPKEIISTILSNYLTKSGAAENRQ